MKTKKKEMITVEVKKEIIEKYERGIQVADVASHWIGFWLKWHEKIPVGQQVTLIPLLLNNKPFSSSNLYRLPHCTGTTMYIYHVQGLEYFVLIIHSAYMNK
jgi:hypothetical protein